MQADTIDEAVQYLQRAFEHESLGREIDLDSALHTPKGQSSPVATSQPTIDPGKN